MKAILWILLVNTNLIFFYELFFYFSESFSRCLCFLPYDKSSISPQSPYLKWEVEINVCFVTSLISASLPSFPKRPPFIRAEPVSSRKKHIFYFKNVRHSRELSYDVSAACQAFLHKWEKLLRIHKMLHFLPKLSPSLHSFADNESDCSSAMFKNPKWPLESLSPQVSCLISQDLFSLCPF